MYGQGVRGFFSLSGAQKQINFIYLYMPDCDHLSAWSTSSHDFPALDLPYKANPAKPLITTAGDVLDRLDDDLSVDDLYDL